jgi:hypothetical protein
VYPSSRSYTDFGDGDVLPAVLQCVTHLFVKQGLLDDAFIRTVVSLEHLTHLGLSFSPALVVTKDQIIVGVERLLAIRSLKLIMIVPPTRMLRSLWKDFARIDDERLIVAAEVTVKGHIDEVIQRGSIWENIGVMKGWRLLVF